MGRVRSGPKIRETLEADGFEIGDKTEMVIAGVKFKFSRALNEYQKKNVVYCMAAKIDGAGKRIGELIELDTSHIGFAANNLLPFRIGESKGFFLLSRNPTRSLPASTRCGGPSPSGWRPQ